MGNKGILELGLLEVSGLPAADPEVSIRILEKPKNRVVADLRGLQIRADSKLKLELPAFPEVGTMDCEVSPSRFRARRSGAFVLTSGETVSRDLTVFRQPERWSAQFDRWSSLTSAFEPLKRVLEASPRVVARGGPVIGKPVSDAYDQLDGPLLINAKACLLNLFAKLSDLAPPTSSKPDWFSFVRTILTIGRERFVAVVDPAMGTAVGRIKEDLAQFPDYENTPAGNHHKNFPAAFDVSRSKLFSVKTSERHGNLQLTLGPGKDPDTGQAVLLLDTDIDENGDLFNHLIDVFRHKFKGGTHPFDIHEFLELSRPGRPLGYRLV